MVYHTVINFLLSAEVASGGGAGGQEQETQGGNTVPQYQSLLGPHSGTHTTRRHGCCGKGEVGTRVHTPRRGCLRRTGHAVSNAVVN